MSNFVKSPNFLLILISIAFIIIPFFWLKQGEMDLGGDTTRLYFYDPIAYLKNAGISIIAPDGIGVAFPTLHLLPYLLFIAGIKTIVQSPYLVITVFNILKLLGGFLAVYLIVLELLKITSLKKEKDEKDSSRFAAILAGLFYILSPLITGNWDKALIPHDQIVIHPLIFFLVFKFFVTNNAKYIWFALLVGLIFAPLIYSPAFFAFYPFAIVFLILVLIMTKTNKASWKNILLSILFFVGLHAFHFLPQLASILDPGSFANTRIFDKASIIHEGVRYFIGVLPLAKVSANILFLSANQVFQFVSLLIPLSILLALIIIKRKQTIFLLTGVFFLLTLYLLSANITNIGVELYKQLFYIPGFSMFRNFIGQWTMVHVFFYTLLFGQGLKIIFNKFGKPVYTYGSFCLATLFILSSWQFLQGMQINKIHPESNNIHIPIQMDPQYEETLQYIKNISDESKILILPYSDAFNQVISGKDGGAYIGPSSISYLTGKKSFAGYQVMTASFSERLFALAREKDYEGIKRLMAYMNIKYIFYNSDKRIYDIDFPTSPYTYARQSLPITQKEYKAFVSKIAGKKVYEKGPYQIFSVEENKYLPLFYIAKKVDFYKGINKDKTPDPSLFLNKKNEEIRTVYVDEESCLQLIKSRDCTKHATTRSYPTISFERINSTRYKLEITNAKEPYFLVFLNAYHQQWEIFIPETDLQNKTSYFNRDIMEGKHVEMSIDSLLGNEKLKMVNAAHTVGDGYANVWYITPQDTGNFKNYELIVEMTGQSIFNITLFISTVIFILFIFWGIKLFLIDIITGIIKNIHAKKNS